MPKKKATEVVSENQTNLDPEMNATSAEEAPAKKPRASRAKKTEGTESAAAPAPKKKKIGGTAGVTRVWARVLYIEPILGTSPSDSEITRRFIASKAPDAPSMEEEVAATGAEEVTDRTTTVFSRDTDGTPIHWDYQWKGHEKDAWSMLKKVTGSMSEDIKAGKKLIDKGIFPGPRRIPILFSGKIGYCERPLRANTPKGERVSLAISEQIPAGAHSDVYFDCLVPGDADFVREVLNYGRFSGMGQWRNSGKGRFLWEEHEGGFDGPVIGGNFAEYYPGGYEEFAAEFPAFCLD